MLSDQLAERSGAATSPIFPFLGFGLGLRPRHYAYIFEHWPQVDWFEVISENFMDTDGRPRRNLARIRERYPVVMHGVAMSIGATDPLNREYLKKLKTMIDWLQPAWVSDHLCWTGVAHRNTHDLLPVPYTEEALAHIVARIKQVQDYLERPIALENPSTYLEFKSATLSECEFIRRMAEDSGCNLLLDVNNVYVSCFNHGLDAQSYIDTLPMDRVIQIHLSGHSNEGTHIIDTHDDYVVDDVWSLYKYTVNKAGRIPNTMVEWDDHIPEFDILYKEVEKARTVAHASSHGSGVPDLFRPRTPYLPNIRLGLSEEQVRMQDAIIARVDTDPSSWVRETENLSPNDRLDIYVHAYRYRLYDVVAEDYPVLEYYLGKDKFQDLIWSFVNKTPHEHFNIARYAAKLPAFIVAVRPRDKRSHEICALETVLCQLADAEETEAIGPERLQSLPPDAVDSAVFHPRKALQLMEFSYDINAYYTAFMEDRKPERPARKKSFLVIFRDNDVMWRMGVGKQEFMLMKNLFSGLRLGKALSTTSASQKNIKTWFFSWIRHRLIADIQT
jgi:uncharacterized protein (UPF0276 family)